MTEEERAAAARLLAAARQTADYICERCGKPFTARRSTGEDNRPRYCSDRCRWQVANDKRRSKAAGGTPPADLTTPPRPREGRDATPS
jgi:hypothetical protein